MTALGDGIKGLVILGHGCLIALVMNVLQQGTSHSCGR